MIVNVKLNNLVWMLTGRSSGFAYPLLNTYISVPPVEDARTQKARDILKLGVKGIDFFVYGALASVYSSLYYMRGLSVENQAAFTPSVIPFQYRTSDVYQRVDGEVVYLTGNPVVLPNSNAWTFLPYYDTQDLSVLRNPIDWDAPHDALNLVLDGSDLTISKYWLGTFVESITIPVTVVPGEPLQVDAQEFAGLRAAFDITAGSETWINTPPTLYPYKMLRARIAQDIDMINFMLNMGTLGSFHEASNDMLAIGALAAAIIRRLTIDGAAIGPSYSVSLDYDSAVYVDMDLIPYLDPLSLLYTSPIAVAGSIPDTMQLVVRFDNPPATCNGQ